jgi:hypothetical protein
MATVRFQDSASYELKAEKYLIPGFSVKNKIIPDYPSQKVFGPEIYFFRVT